MQLQFVKNIQFTKTIKAEGRLREFNFRKVNNPEDPHFTVDVVDDRGNRIMFRMRRENSGWQISHQTLLPSWILANEENFSQQIEEELANYE
jgi:hypothetical protein